jgi:hypothetical protein
MIVQLLEGIGAISAAKSKKAMSRSGNYQDSVTAPLGRMHDDDAVGSDDEDEQEDTLELDRGGSILSAVEKVGAIILTSDGLLISVCSFERLSAPYDQAPSANRVGSIK